MHIQEEIRSGGNLNNNKNELHMFRSIRTTVQANENSKNQSLVNNLRCGKELREENKFEEMCSEFGKNNGRDDKCRVLFGGTEF